MADMLKGIFGGKAAGEQKVVDGDFADFAGAPDPSPVSFASSPTGLASASQTGRPMVPYTKWYRVWERVSPSDFKQEAYLMPIILLIVLVHTFGSRSNKKRAKAWMSAHKPILDSEFAIVGFGKAGGEDVLKEKSKSEYTSYATGRQNVAFCDIKIDLHKRHNPMVWGAEAVLSLFFEGIAAPVEKVEATLYPFDGREKDTVPASPMDLENIEAAAKNNGPSTYDPFVFAIVNKLAMRKLRDSRYDVSLTQTKDHAKLPKWCSVMTESAEITEKLLTTDLIKAIEEAGPDVFEYIIITDQPIDKPTKLEEVTTLKRIYLSTYLHAATPSTTALFSAFLRLPDTLVSQARFRPEVTRKIRSLRDEEVQKLKRADDEEKAEERKLAAEKLKKEVRDRKLRGLSAEEQRRVLEKEEEKKRRKGMKKMVRAG